MSIINANRLITPISASHLLVRILALFYMDNISLYKYLCEILLAQNLVFHNCVSTSFLPIVNYPRQYADFV